MFDNAVIFRGSFQPLRVEYRHTNGVLLLWKKKDTSHVFLRLHPRDLSQMIASQSAILFWNNDGSIPSDNIDNTPEQNTNVDPPPGLPPQQNNNQDDDKPPEPFNTPLSSPHLPDVPMPDDPHTPNPGFPPMMILFTHHFNHHHDQVMKHQMMKCIHHRMNHLIYHHIHRHHRIIHNHHFPEPMPFLLLQIPLLCPIRLYRQTLRTHQ